MTMAMRTSRLRDNDTGYGDKGLTESLTTIYLWVGRKRDRHLSLKSGPHRAGPQSYKHTGMGQREDKCGPYPWACLLTSKASKLGRKEARARDEMR